MWLPLVILLKSYEIYRLKIFKQNKLIHLLSLNSISVMVSFITGLIISKIIAVFLGTSGMAILGSFRNFTSLLKSTATLGITNAAVKLMVENKNDKKELSQLYSTFFWFFLVISCCLCLLVLLFSTTISEYLFLTESFSVIIRYFAFTLPLVVITTLWASVFNSFEKFEQIISIQILSNLLVFAVTALLIWKNNITGGLVSMAIGEILLLVTTLYFFQKEKHQFEFELLFVIKKKYFKSIGKFIFMALISAIIVPLTLIFIRYEITQQYNIQAAGVWDATNRLSNFYMLFFSSGLTLYYMPKLAKLQSEKAFNRELRFYFKTIVPLFLITMIGVFLCRNIILEIAFTKEFNAINSILIWQLAGDFFKIMTLAFGFQILVKTMILRYLIIEIIFNVCYYIISFYLMKSSQVEGVLQAYFYANLITFFVIIMMFRKNLFKSKDEIILI
jgi:O-antigen/teichoic acid export membrane protein